MRGVYIQREERQQEEHQDNDELSAIEKFQENDMNLLSESKISLDTADGVSYESQSWWSN